MSYRVAPHAPRPWRHWLAAGICGALIIAALPMVWEVWAINRAGMLVNRAIVSGNADEQNLAEAMDLMESLAERGPHTASREIPIWRTYGAAAALRPSDHAFELLRRSRNAERVDRVGELWLGEVASFTGHWEEAEEAYSRIDASNLLIHRAETSLQAGDRQAAVHQFLLAKRSLDAAHERATSESLLLDRTGDEPSAASRLMHLSTERVTALYQIGRGLLNAGQPAQAVPVLEEALSAAETDSPGVMMEQSITLTLGLALAKTLPESDGPKIKSAHEYGYFALGEEESAAVGALIRIRALAYRGVEMDPTASACVQAGRSLLLAGDDAQAVAYLKQAIGLDPLLAEAYLVLGSHYEERGMVIIARELYAVGTKALPANTALAGAHAVTSYHTLPPEDVRPLLERAVALDGADPFVFASLADCYVDLGLITEARVILHEGLRAYPGAEPLLERLMSLPRVDRIRP